MSAWKSGSWAPQVPGPYVRFDNLIVGISKHHVEIDWTSEFTHFAQASH